MEIIYSKIQPKLILHIVVRKTDFDKERTEVIEPYNFLQLALLKLPKGKTFRPHKHIPNYDQPKSRLPQESFVVIKGKVKCIFYDVDDTIIAEPILNAGEASITLQAGHNYEILRKDTIIYEFKTGPYQGVEKDKVFIE